MNNLLKFIFLGTIFFFLTLYYGKYTANYYENKKVLTDEAILQFEKDLKEGKEIIPENYITKEKNYNNKISSLGIKLSRWIESTFHKALKWIMKTLNNYSKE